MMVLKEMENGHGLVLICVTVIVVSFQIGPINGFTRLQASTDFACIGENVTFSCTTSNSYLIWEITFTDRTIGSTTYSFQMRDRQGKFYSESIRGMHLFFQLTSNTNGTLGSILVAQVSALLENAKIECHATRTAHRTVRFAYAPNTPTGVQVSERVYNSSEFASVTLSWNDPAGRVDSYNIKILVGSNNSQQFSVTVPSLNLNQIPYNENVTVGISAVNCVAESEEVNISFVIDVCDFNLSLPHGGLLYNNSISSNSVDLVLLYGVVPSGEQIWFGCEPEFYPREPIISTCQEGGLWFPDPSELVCQNITVTSSSEERNCANCPIYIITGSVVGIIILLVVCGLLLAVIICIIIHSNKTITLRLDEDRYRQGRPDPSIPLYEDIASPTAVYECLVTSVMTENEAYNTCCDEIRAYNIV